MWSGGTFHFEQRLVLLSEGPADRRLLEKLVQAKRLPKFDFPWPVFGDEDAPEGARRLHSVDKFQDMLEALNAIFRSNPSLKEQIIGVLIVADARDEPITTFSKIRKQIQSAGLFGLPTKECEAARANNGHPAISVILLPGEGKPGALETLYVQALSVRYRSAARCMREYLECGTIKVRTWSAEKKAKAELQCLVAATNEDDPSKAAGYLLSWKKNQKPVITMTQTCFKPVHKALQEFCKQVGA